MKVIYCISMSSKLIMNKIMWCGSKKECSYHQSPNDFMQKWPFCLHDVNLFTAVAKLNYYLSNKAYHLSKIQAIPLLRYNRFLFGYYSLIILFIIQWCRIGYCYLRKGLERPFRSTEVNIRKNPNYQLCKKYYSLLLNFTKIPIIMNYCNFVTFIYMADTPVCW